ncbi:MAG: hypothetical protein ACK4NF_03815 [Planctomycetota bacterium]
MKKFILMPILIAIGGGLLLGEHIVFPIGFNLKLPGHLNIWIQTHAHLQLVGWLGLFTIGLSLFFLSQLAGGIKNNTKIFNLIFYFISSGLLLSASCEFSSAYLENIFILKIAQIIGFILEMNGILIYISAILTFLLQDERKNVLLLSIKNYIYLAACGWFVYLLSKTIDKLAPYINITIYIPLEIYIQFIFFPLIFAFSMILLPAFLHLPPPQLTLFKKLSYLYSSVVILNQLLNLSSHTTSGIDLLNLLWNGLTVYLILKLKIIERIIFYSRYKKHPARIIFEKEKPGLENVSVRKQPRSGYSDYGEFGRFELLIYGSYIWFIIYSILFSIMSVCKLFGISIFHGINTLRHIFFLGFATQLILGVGYRILPGIFQRRRLYYPKLVVLTFIFINWACIGRIGWLILPMKSPNYINFVEKVLMFNYGISGILAIIALLIFGLNVWKTINYNAKN